MWHTPQGVRVLRGPEAHLFKTGVLLLQEQIEDSLDSAEYDLNIPTGVSTFDMLEPEEKYIAIAAVARGLLSSKAQAETTVPWHQAAIYAIYRTLKTNVQVEIGMERQTDIRQQIKNAYLQASDAVGEYDTVIDLEHDHCTEWHARIDLLTTLVVNVESAQQPTKGPGISHDKFKKAENFLKRLRRER